jgi:hypothetical protein
MTTKDYGSTILKNLEARGYTKDMIIGHLTGVLNGLKYINYKHLHEFMDREIDYSNSKPIDHEQFKPATV